MEESMVFTLLEIYRNRTLEKVKEIEAAQANVVPAGFNNNILWNLGHILTVQELFAMKFIGEPMGLPEEITSLFNNGTKPADWQGPAPELSAVVKLLEEQPARLREKLQGRLQTKISVPFVPQISTLEELLIFGIGHESMHVGTILAMKKITA